MARIALVLLGVLLANVALAEEKTADECMAPDFEHEVVLTANGDDSDTYELLIRAPGAETPLFSRVAGGYAYFKAAIWPANFKCLWSPDGKFVAIYERGTKRSGDATLYHTTGNKVFAVTVPDVDALLKKAVPGELRSIWIKPELWLPDRQLALSVEGELTRGESSRFRFILVLQIPKPSEHMKASVVSFRRETQLPTQ